VSTRRPATGRFLQLLALSASGVGQPLLGLMADYPGFLVAHRSTPGDVVLLALALLTAPALALFALTRAVGLVSRQGELIAHGLFMAGFSSLIMLHWLGRLMPDVAAPSLVGAVVFGALFAAGVARSSILRGITELYSAMVLVFLALFLADSDIRALVFQASPPAIESPRIRESTPIVMVIFDELPLSSLLDADGQIDRDRFPAFAKLADRSTWFRNTTGVASYTQQAVPAILTGRYPGTEPRLAIASEHPYNLFSMLAGSHELNVFESQMQLADPDQLPRPPVARGMRPLFGDLFIVYLHVVLPASLATELPAVSESWKDFAGDEEDRDPADAEGGSHPAHFRRFVDSIEATDEGVLHFIHSSLPHRPWHYLPSGKVYFPHRQHGLTVQFRTLSGDWWQQEACQRHLLQLRFADRLLGELLQRLEALNLFERSLVVVTADHGVAFWPDDNQRMVGLSDHPEEILSLPLLVKRPHQERGYVDDRNVETVDILPTIAHLVGAELGSDSGSGSGDIAQDAFEFDGCALFDPACEERPDKVAYWSIEPQPKSMQVLRFDKELGLGDEGLRRKLAWFGEGLYRFGPHAELVGRRLASLDVGPDYAGRLVLDTPGRPGSRGLGERFAPVRVSGLLELAHEPGYTPQVAVALAGRIQTVVPAPVEGAAGRRVLAMIPEEALAAGSTPELFLVEGTPEGPRLLPLELR